MRAAGRRWCPWGDFSRGGCNGPGVSSLPHKWLIWGGGGYAMTSLRRELPERVAVAHLGKHAILHARLGQIWAEASAALRKAVDGGGGGFRRLAAASPQAAEKP